MYITDEEIQEMALKVQERVDLIKRRWPDVPTDSGPYKMRIRNEKLVEELLAEVDKPLNKRRFKLEFGSF